MCFCNFWFYNIYFSFIYLVLVLAQFLVIPVRKATFSFEVFHQTIVFYFSFILIPVSTLTALSQVL